MLRYLTHKLRTQTLNENDPFQCKADDDHDSGTESDEESADIEELQRYMRNHVHLEGRNAESLCCPSGSLEVTSGADNAAGQERLHQPSRTSKTDMDSPLPEPAMDSALPSDSDHNFDQHSSEEELEVINSASIVKERNNQYPEKRKWSQANRLSVGDNSGSSDEEVRDVVCFSTPVEFRASPPANVYKPGRSLSPPPKVFHFSAEIPQFEVCAVSPRKRHRQTPTASGGATVQRPCLDFEKMQQVGKLSFTLYSLGDSPQLALVS